MKRERVRLVLVAAISLALLQACGIFPRRGPSALVGTWTNTSGTVWTVKPNGTFDVDLNGDGKREAWGKYSVDSDLVTLRGTGGFIPKGCKGAGVYHFTRTAEDKLAFTLVQDSCKVRRTNLLLPWRRK